MGGQGTDSPELTSAAPVGQHRVQKPETRFAGNWEPRKHERQETEWKGQDGWKSETRNQKLETLNQNRNRR